jgi:gliding motility-associated-like protein
LCGNTTTLAGNTPTDGIGTWTVVSGSGTITNPSSPTSGITGLGTGVNVFQWTIANAPCPASSDTVAITSETAIGQIDNQTNVKCFGDSTGSVTVSMTGGTAPITYIWSQDATNNTNSASDLPAGSYSVAISDLYGACLDTINILITQPTKLTDSILSQDVMCYGLSDGILSVNVSGGTNPYTYVWNTIPAQYTATVTGLSQGTYTVTITDHNNCNTTVSGSVNEPATLSVLDSIINPICFGGNSGSVYLTVTGGTSPYNYHWTNNESSQDLLNIGEGSYIVTVTDAHNCTMTSISHLFNPPAIIITDTMTISATNTGNIDITVSGGTVPYTYLWSNGATTQDISNLGNAIYIVTVTDMNTCAVTDTISVNIPELPVIIPTLFSPNGDGKNDTWEIKGIQQFTDAHIMIYNRWGNLVFEYNGTAIGYLDTGKRWDGKYNGKDLPMGSYVYIVIFDGTKTYNGVVSIAR